MRIIIIALLTSLLMPQLNAQEWQTDLDSAKITAKNENKTIILVFQGSDWCAPCIKLDREIWSSEVFKNYAKDNFVLVKADFPRRKKNQLPKELQEKNNLLAEKYNKQGFFPFVVILNCEEKVLGTTGYKKVTPAEYIKILTSF
ncbi:MAG: thioredoxin family protein [Bacteroidales bacterium]|nr:thioredoxin family protein [Bacteroidales bacterium]